MRCCCCCGHCASCPARRRARQTRPGGLGWVGSGQWLLSNTRVALANTFPSFALFVHSLSQLAAAAQRATFYGLWLAKCEKRRERERGVGGRDCGPLRSFALQSECCLCRAQLPGKIYRVDGEGWGGDQTRAVVAELGERIDGAGVGVRQSDRGVALLLTWFARFVASVAFNTQGDAMR